MYTPLYTLQKELVLQQGMLFGWDNTMPSFQRTCTSKSCNCIFMAPHFLRKNLLYLQHKASLLYQQQFQLPEAFHFQASCSTDTSEHICITKPVLAQPRWHNSCWRCSSGWQENHFSCHSNTAYPAQHNLKWQNHLCIRVAVADTRGVSICCLVNTLA